MIVPIRNMGIDGMETSTCSYGSDSQVEIDITKNERRVASKIDTSISSTTLLRGIRTASSIDKCMILKEEPRSINTCFSFTSCTWVVK